MWMRLHERECVCVCVWCVCVVCVCVLACAHAFACEVVHSCEHDMLVHEFE